MTGKCHHWSNHETNKFELWCLATNANRSRSYAQRLCLWCLEPGHTNRECTSEDDHGCPCGSNNNAFICVKTADCVSRANWNQTSGNTVAAIANSTIVNGTRIGAALNPILKVKLSNSNTVLRTLFDNGSQTTFLLESVARKLNLSGKRISFVLITTDGFHTKKTGFLYDISLRDVYGNTHNIQAIGMEQISSNYAGAKIKNVKRVLQYNIKCTLLTDDKLDQDGGEIQLLVGTDKASIHPEKIASIGDLIIMKSIFGSGYAVMGHSTEHVKMNNSKEEFKVHVAAVKNVKNIKKIDPNQLFIKSMSSALNKLAPNLRYSSVKTIPNNIVRTPQKLHENSKPLIKQHKPSVFKYAKRNVRGLALIITAEEKKKTESFKIDDARLAFNRIPEEQNDVKEIQNSEAEDNVDDDTNSMKEESDNMEVGEKEKNDLKKFYD